VADDERPFVSIVIASRVGGDALLDCIGSFARISDDRCQIIVSECTGAGTPAAIAAKFPGVDVRHAPDRRSIPQLRAAGIAAAHGDVIALTTGWCQADAGWLTAVRRAHRGGVAAVGGAIEYGGRHRLSDRAVFFCEYGRYLPPFGKGPTHDLPGQNVAYTRAALDAVRDLVAAGTWEPLWHWRLQSEGATLVRDPAILVRMARPYTFRGFVAERYHYSRAFAGQRFSDRPWTHRLVFAAGTVLLPPLLVMRFVRVLIARRGRLLEWAPVLPAIAVFTIPWAVGEMIGCLAGPGPSAGRID
jgi:hypothetical protein